MNGGLLRDHGGRLRSGWRFALWLSLVAALGGLTAMLVVALGVQHISPGAQAAFVFAVAVPSVALWRMADGRPWSDTPIALDRRASQAFGIGLVTGFLMIGLAVAILFAGDAYRVETRPCDVTAQTAFLGRWLTIFLFAAAIEELLFRGYALFALSDGIGRVPAIALTAIVFSLGHAGNPHYDWPAALAIAWIGALLGAWVLASGTLWGAFGLHLGWNCALSVGAALPISGLRITPPCYVGVAAGPEWLTGGAFGLEGGILAVLLWGMAGAALWRLEAVRRRSRSADP